MPIAIITGASMGIGLETAKGLAEKNFDLILISRNINKLNHVKESIESTYQVKCNVFSYDLSLMRSNFELHKLITKEYKKIDVLINNVGAIFMDRTITDEGLEKTFALNHMSYFILSNLFAESFESLKIINVSSEAHRGITLRLNDFQNKQEYYGWHAYKRSKLANIYFTYELNKKSMDKDLTVNCLHPGLVNSDFANNNSLPFKIVSSLIKYFGISTKEGAQTSIYLATEADLADISGLYFDKCRPRKSSSISYNNEISESLWAYSFEIMNNFST